MTEGTFSLVPIEIATDKRLTLRHIRVLVALLSFRAKNTDLVWPKRETLAARCGMHLCDISTATTELVALGWLKKDGNGGFSRATRYQITVPEVTNTVVPDTTVAHSATVVQSTTQTVVPDTTHTVVHSTTGKEQTIEQTIEDKKSSTHPQADARTAKPRNSDRLEQSESRLAKPADVGPQVWADWLKLRRAKKAPATETVIRLIRIEAKKASMSLEDALAMSCANGWMGFRAAWAVKSAAELEEAKRRPVGRLQTADDFLAASRHGIRQREELRAKGIDPLNPFAPVAGTIEGVVHEVG